MSRNWANMAALYEGEKGGGGMGPDIFFKKKSGVGVP